MDDLISRQAAIARAVPLNLFGREVMLVSVSELENLPSAQPEIIRCKDCKHKHIENMVWTCPFGLPGGPDFYCGYGAERRPE